MTYPILPAGSKPIHNSNHYFIQKSLRLRKSASAYLIRTQGISTNQYIGTWSFWLKRGTLGTVQRLFEGYTASSDTGDAQIEFQADDTLYIGGWTTNWRVTTQVFRDPSAWYHIVVAVDTTQVTANNRIKVYVNGSEITSFSTTANPTQNTTFGLNNNSSALQIGRRRGLNDLYFDGYMAEVNFIDGQALTSSSFGEYSTYDGVWIPKKYTGTYGTNGFHLDFKNNANLGKDAAGSNDWTLNGIDPAIDHMNDVPTLTSPSQANYATLNPLIPSHSALTNGNLTSAGTNNMPTIVPSSGSWYFEVDNNPHQWILPAAFPALSGSFNFGQRPFTGVIPTGFKALNTFNLPTSTIVKGNTVMDATIYTSNGGVQTVTNAGSFKPDLVWTKTRSNIGGNIVNDSVRGASLYFTAHTTNAELPDANYLTSFNSNGFSLGSKNFTNGYTIVGWQWQAGQGSTSSNTDGTITSTTSVNATAGFSIVTYTGTGSNATVGHGLGVAPSMVIVKGRSVAGYSWTIWNAPNVSANGAAAVLALESRSAWFNRTTAFNSTSPTSSVFSLGTDLGTNTNSGTYVAYCWTPIAGYSAFGSYTGNASTDGAFVYTGFIPKYLMIKNSSVTGCDWVVWDSARNTYNVAANILAANQSSAEATNSSYYFDFLSNGFKVRAANAVVNGSTNTIIYMAFAENPTKYSNAR